MDAYNHLMEKYKDVAVLSSVSSVLHWDLETYMPPRGIELRSMQLAQMREIVHARETDPEIGRLLEGLEQSSTLDAMTEVQRRNVHLARKDYDRMTKLPPTLVKALAKQVPLTIDIWKKAKAKQDFSLYLPALEKIMDLTKQKATSLDPDKDPYDVLMDLYEPNLTSEVVTRLFTPLKQGLKKIIDKCLTHGADFNHTFLHARVPIAVQRALGPKLCAFVGYDFERGRLDETEHPFTGGLYDDVRILTHYHEDNFTSAIFSILHEAGHGIYEQNLPREWHWQPVGSAASLGIHESQSRFVENIVGKSPEFWAYFYPIVQKTVGEVLAGVSLEAFLQAINQVQPSKIRIEADEATYSLHVVLRFEIERDLMHEKLTVAELPQVWDEKMETLLGVTVENDAEGVMQDTHWAGGSIGYFPTYALGNIYDGMFLVALEKAAPNWRDSLAHGDISPVRDWMQSQVWTRGNLYDPLPLVEQVTGKAADPAPFLSYLEAKMARVYNF